MDKNSLQLLSNYIDNKGSKVRFNAEIESQPFKTFNVLNYERNVYTLIITVNGLEVTDIGIFGSEFSVKVSVPYEKSLGDMSFLMGAWKLTDGEAGDRITAELEENYVSFNLEETGDYIVGSNPYSNISITVVVIAIFIILVFLLLLLGGSGKKKKKKN